MIGPGEAFPALAVADLDGVSRSLAQAWAEGPAIVAVGHRDCGTTRLTLTCLERVYARKAPGTSVVGVLQDTPAVARELGEGLGLSMPLWLEEDPYPLTRALDLTAVPAVFLIDRAGVVQKAWEAFRRADIEEAAAVLGVTGVFEPTDKAPALRPG